MILSVSRRTDIPAFYSTWFMNRIKEGYVLVRNPFSYHQVSKINLDPQVIDCIVFWTKNAKPMLPHIKEIKEKYPFYFQYSLNGYGHDIETKLPSLSEKLDSFKQLSEQIGAQRIVWRYDPILITDTHSIQWHIDCYDNLAAQLKGYTTTCVFSFVDLYDKVKTNIEGLGIRSCTEQEMNELAASFSHIAKANNISLQTCAEVIDLDQYGIKHGCCIDGELIKQITGFQLSAKKDKNQRAECGCLESVDIGQYNTCRHGCRYCYANFNPQSVISFSKQHNPNSPLLIGEVEENDKITERKMSSLRISESQEQLSLFDL